MKYHEHKTTNYSKESRFCIICNEVETYWTDGICSFCADLCPNHIPDDQINMWLIETKKAGKIEI